MVYIDKQYTDGEERAKVFPQCVWLWGKICLSQGNAGTAYEVCRKGIDCLAENGSLSMLYHLLELEEECQKKLGKENLLHKVQEQKAAVKFLYDIVGTVMPSERIAEFIYVSRQSEILVANELLKEVRLEQNLSQEELSTDICTQETLSRIECGKDARIQKIYMGCCGKWEWKESGFMALLSRMTMSCTRKLDGINERFQKEKWMLQKCCWMN